jgi:hypothetical protein
MSKKKCCCACCLLFDQRPSQVILFPNDTFTGGITLSGAWSTVEYFGVPQECCLKFTSNPVSISNLTNFNICVDIANRSRIYECKYREYYWDYFDFPIVTDCSQATPVSGRLMYERTFHSEYDNKTKFQYLVNNMYFEIFLTRKEVLVEYVPTCVWFVTVNLICNDAERKIRVAQNEYTYTYQTGVLDATWKTCMGTDGRLEGSTTPIEIGDPDANPCTTPSLTNPSPRITRSWNGLTRPTQLLFPQGATAEHILEPCVEAVDDIEEYFWDSSTYCNLPASCSSIGGNNPSTLSSPPAVPTIPAGRFAAGHYCFNGTYFNVDTYSPSSCTIGTNGGFSRFRYMCDFDIISGCRKLYWLDSYSSTCNILDPSPYTLLRPTFGLEFVW